MATLAVHTRQSIARWRETTSVETLAPRVNDIGLDATIGPTKTDLAMPAA
jgi:hypothetical protein